MRKKGKREKGKREKCSKEGIPNHDHRQIDQTSLRYEQGKGKKVSPKVKKFDKGKG